jgi:phosphotransferase system  glucose/maltose/N-acetylglucosamine-specific IIC component
MFSDKIVFGGAMISAALSGIAVGLFDVQGTAYVPSITAPVLSTNPIGFLISMLVGMVSAFLITLFANKLHRSKKVEG